MPGNFARMDDYSDLLEESAEKLGTQGYCDIAAEVLLESFPHAAIHRFTDGESFGHVCLIVNGQAVDITGFKTIQEMSSTKACEGLQREAVTLDAVRAHFRNHGRTPEERRIVRGRFVDHVAQNPQIFQPDAKPQSE